MNQPIFLNKVHTNKLMKNQIIKREKLNKTPTWWSSTENSHESTLMIINSKLIGTTWSSREQIWTRQQHNDQQQTHMNLPIFLNKVHTNKLMDNQIIRRANWSRYQHDYQQQSDMNQPIFLNKVHSNELMKNKIIRRAKLSKTPTWWSTSNLKESTNFPEQNTHQNN